MPRSRKVISKKGTYIRGASFESTRYNQFGDDVRKGRGYKSPDMESDWNSTSSANKRRREYARLREFEQVNHDFRPRGRKKLW